jgi:hypothetical protein
METILAGLICVLVIGTVVLVTIVHSMGIRLDILESQVRHLCVNEENTEDCFRLLNSDLRSLSKAVVELKEGTK